MFTEKQIKDMSNEELIAAFEECETENATGKLELNGSFGKLGSRYSILYAPDLLINTTLTGQLSLLMLIEELELAGIKVISANTDGFVSVMNKDQYNNYDAICNAWEFNTGLNLEETAYKAIYSRDVNNYLAITVDDKKKGKGVFTLGQLSKNPASEISILAVIEYLTNGTPIADTILNCKDILHFVTIKTVNGGGVWRDQYLGKVVRWVYVTNGSPITYVKNGNKVGTSDGCMPVMDLIELPDNLDYDKYIDISNKLLQSVLK